SLLLLIEYTVDNQNPYSDLITYIVVPSILAFGLFIVVGGGLIERRRRRKSLTLEIAKFPVLDLNNASRRRSLIVFMSLAFAFLFITAFGSYRAYEYTESVIFCGQACQSVLMP